MTDPEDQAWEDALHDACFPVTFTDVHVGIRPVSPNGTVPSSPSTGNSTAIRSRSSPTAIA